MLLKEIGETRSTDQRH